MRELVIDERELATQDAFHAHVAAGLGFPAHYGANLAALADCLGDVCVPTRVAVAYGLTPSPWFARAIRVVARAAMDNPNLHVVMRRASMAG